MSTELAHEGGKVVIGHLHTQEISVRRRFDFRATQYGRKDYVNEKIQ